MSIATIDDSVEELELKVKSLNQQRDIQQRMKDKIEAHKDAARKNLKDLLDGARKAGFDPENLQEEIRHSKEVLVVKINTFAADLDESEKAMRPMKQAIEGS